MRAARRAGLLTCAFVWDDVSAVRMSLAGVDVLAPHIGVTRAPSSEGGLPAAAAQIEQIAAAGRSVRDDLIVVFHGGPAARPHEVARVLEVADGLHGFIGASSFERYPVERAIADAVSELVQAGNGRGCGRFHGSRFRYAATGDPARADRGDAAGIPSATRACQRRRGAPRRGVRGRRVERRSPLGSRR